MTNTVTRATNAVILDPSTSPDERSANGADALLAAGEIILKAMLEGVQHSSPAPSAFDLRDGKRPLTVRI
jgi:hypothetical protein